MAAVFRTNFLRLDFKRISRVINNKSLRAKDYFLEMLDMYLYLEEVEDVVYLRNEFHSC